MSPAEHDRLNGAIDEVMSVLARKRRTFIAATSNAEYEWAQRNAVVARQSELEFRVALPAAPPAAILPGDWRVAEERNRAMADNVRWVLAQEGPAGRVLVFAHNAHIMNAQLEGGIWNAFERAPNAMGLYREADRAFANGDRVQLTAPRRHDRERHLANRELGTIESMSAKGDLRLRLDCTYAMAAGRDGRHQSVPMVRQGIFGLAIGFIWLAGTISVICLAINDMAII